MKYRMYVDDLTVTDTVADWGKAVNRAKKRTIAPEGASQFSGVISLNLQRNPESTS